MASYTVKHLDKIHVSTRGGRRLYFLNSSNQSMHTVENLQHGDWAVEKHIKEGTILTGVKIIHHNYTNYNLTDFDHESVKVNIHERFQIKVDGDGHQLNHDFDIGFVSTQPHTCKAYTHKGYVVAIHVIFVSKHHHEDHSQPMYPPAPQQMYPPIQYSTYQSNPAPQYIPQPYGTNVSYTNVPPTALPPGPFYAPLPGNVAPAIQTTPDDTPMPGKN